MRPRPSYAERMSTGPALEDARGVDLGQIRQQRRLPVDERVRTMVEAANVILAMQDAAPPPMLTSGPAASNVGSSASAR